MGLMTKDCCAGCKSYPGRLESQYSGVITFRGRGRWNHRGSLTGLNVIDAASIPGDQVLAALHPGAVAHGGAE